MPRTNEIGECCANYQLARHLFLVYFYPVPSLANDRANFINGFKRKQDGTLSVYCDLNFGIVG